MSAAPAITACRSASGRPKTGYRWGRRLLRAARLTSRECGQPTRWYRCSSCGWWHVTKREAWER